MEDLIDKLRTYEKYFSQVVSSQNDVEFSTESDWDWTFFNRDTILELTAGYNVSEYKGKNTLLLAQMNDEGLFLDLQNKVLYISSMSSMYDKSQEIIIPDNLDSILENSSVLDEYIYEKKQILCNFKDG